LQETQKTEVWAVTVKLL